MDCLFTDGGECLALNVIAAYKGYNYSRASETLQDLKPFLSRPLQTEKQLDTNAIFAPVVFSTLQEALAVLGNLPKDLKPDSQAQIREETVLEALREHFDKVNNELP